MKARYGMTQFVTTAEDIVADLYEEKIALGADGTEWVMVNVGRFYDIARQEYFSPSCDWSSNVFSNR